MPLTRRSVLLRSAACAFGLSTTSCGQVGFWHGSSGGDAGFPGAKEVAAALRDLVKEAGRETFQSVGVYSGRTGDGRLIARLLTAGGGVQTFTYRRGWRNSDYEDKSILTSPASVRIAELPLDRLPAFVAAAGAEVAELAFDVDYVGRIRVTATGESGEAGLKLDATGTVPELDLDEVSGVRSAIAEMVAAYGNTAALVGSFNGFVHVDANVAGCRVPVRIVRYPRVAAHAAIVQEALFSASELFDPSGFDPTVVLNRKATIAKEAGVDGKVWDWEYRRPPQGGKPLVSYGIGPTGPSTRVWLADSGKVSAVVSGNCPKGNGWCPK